MIAAAFKALGDLTSPVLRSVLWKALGLTLLLFIAVLVGTEMLLSMMTLVPWPWLQTMIAVGAGLGLIVGFVFLMAPVTAVFAGLFLDTVSAMVEAKHYLGDPPGQPLALMTGLGIALSFGLLVLLINLAVLPLVFTGIGAVALVLANAYLISREYFEMAAMRHMDVRAAKTLRRREARRVFMAGLLPAAMTLFPLVNIVVPLFATAYFTHLYKSMAGAAASSA